MGIQGPRRGGSGGSRAQGRGVGGGRWALTEGHVVAAVREPGVPVTDLGLVAGAGTLGLAGHWVGHGCGGGGQGSAGSLAALLGPRPLPPLPLPGSLGAASRPPTEGTPLRSLPSATSGHRLPSLSRAAASCTSGRAGGGAPARRGKGARPVWAGLRRAAAFSASGPGVLGSCISGASGVQAGRRRLSSRPGCPGEGSSQVPGTGGAAGPSRDPTFAFHVVVHLELHLAGPEEAAALGTAEWQRRQQRSLS